MRGNFFHNLLVARLEHAFRVLGAIVYREYRIATSTVNGFVDLFVIFQLFRIAIEIELTTDRIRWDVFKALALKADMLLIVLPSSRLVRAAQECVDQLKASGKAVNVPVACLTFGGALEWINDSNSRDFRAGFGAPTLPQKRSQQTTGINGKN